MPDDSLSSEEVDVLLKGMARSPGVAQQDSSGTHCRPYNLATQERIVRGRMPTLEIINERFARLLRLGLFNFMRRSANVTAGPVRVIKFSEFVHSLVVPSNLNLVHVKPLRGTSLFVFNPTLVSLVVDNLFGGDGRFQLKNERRDFTQTEQRIIQLRKVMSFCCANFSGKYRPSRASAFNRPYSALAWDLVSHLCHRSRPLWNIRTHQPSRPLRCVMPLSLPPALAMFILL